MVDRSGGRRGTREGLRAGWLVVEQLDQPGMDGWSRRRVDVQGDVLSLVTMLLSGKSVGSFSGLHVIVANSLRRRSVAPLDASPMTTRLARATAFSKPRSRPPGCPCRCTRRRRRIRRRPARTAGGTHPSHLEEVAEAASRLAGHAPPSGPRYQESARAGATGRVRGPEHQLSRSTPGHEVPAHYPTRRC